MNKQVFDELKFSFVRSSGAGGQNVNKLSTKAELRWQLVDSKALKFEIKARLLILCEKLLNSEGELIITSERFRNQIQNKKDCLDKLDALIKRASVLPKRRLKTRPSRRAKERRIKDKKRRSEVKRNRSGSNQSQ